MAKMSLIIQSLAFKAKVGMRRTDWHISKWGGNIKNFNLVGSKGAGKHRLESRSEYAIFLERKVV